MCLLTVLTHLDFLCDVKSTELKLNRNRCKIATVGKVVEAVLRS